MSELERAIEQRAIDEGLPCMEAFAIAEDLGLAPRGVSEAANRTEVRIVHCQLGLFGYQAFGGKRFVATLGSVPKRLTAALREAAAGGNLSCASAWEIAQREGLPRPVVGSAADALGIRIAPCQLGCF